MLGTGRVLSLWVVLCVAWVSTAEAAWTYNPNTNREYDFLIPQSWEDAQTAAAAMSPAAHLVTINDGLEMQYVMDRYAAEFPGVTSPYLWIGIKNQGAAITGPWQWAEGAGAGGSFTKGTGGDSYTNWDGVEPNGDGPYTMVYVSSPRTGAWNDVPGDRDYRPVIERDAEVPTWVLNPDNGQVYTVIANTVHGNSWTNAEALAQRWGGHLVTVNDAAENEWINDEANLNTGGRPYKYIGMHDPTPLDNMWVWASGTGGYWDASAGPGSAGNGTSYTNWRPTEPNSINENAIMIYASDDTWNDVSKVRDFPAIVEADGVIEWFSIPGPGNRYGIINARMTWENAQTIAQQLGMELADIGSSAENEWIRSTFAAELGEDVGLWIGLNDRLIEGTWEWSSGETVGYTNWAADGQLGGNNLEDYVYLDLESGLWRDRDAVNLFYPLLKTVPEPGSLLLLVAGLLALSILPRHKRPSSSA